MHELQFLGCVYLSVPCLYSPFPTAYVHLSNPVEKVPIRRLLAELSRETRLCVPKMELLQFWRSDESLPPESGDLLSGIDQDLSLLARQKDPRWRQFNTLGKNTFHTNVPISRGQFGVKGFQQAVGMVQTGPVGGRPQWSRCFSSCLLKEYFG